MWVSNYDLYLVHFPIGCPYNGDDAEVFPVKDGRFLIDPATSLERVWKGMEAELCAGRAKNIGVSNFNRKQIERILASAKILPTYIQVNNSVKHSHQCIHVLLTPFRLRRMRTVSRRNSENFARGATKFCAYAPLGCPGRKNALQKSGV